VEHPLAMPPQHPLAMPPPASHPLAAPTAASHTPATPVHQAHIQQIHSPSIPAGSERTAAPALSAAPPEPIPLPTQIAEADPEEMMAKFLGRNIPKRHPLQPHQVSQDVQGLRELAAARSWRALLQLSQQLLAETNLAVSSLTTAATAAATEGIAASENEAAAKVRASRELYLEIAAFRVAGLVQMRNVRGAHEELERVASTGATHGASLTYADVRSRLLTYADVC
jgi:hypothetical protein